MINKYDYLTVRNEYILKWYQNGKSGAEIVELLKSNESKIYAETMEYLRELLLDDSDVPYNEIDGMVLKKIKKLKIVIKRHRILNIVKNVPKTGHALSNYWNFSGKFEEDIVESHKKILNILKKSNISATESQIGGAAWLFNTYMDDKIEQIFNELKEKKIL